MKMHLARYVKSKLSFVVQKDNNVDNLTASFSTESQFLGSGSLSLYIICMTTIIKGNLNSSWKLIYSNFL